MSKGARRWRRASVVVLVATAILWGGWKCSEVWSYRQTMARIEDEMEKGLLSRAAKDLAALLAENPGSDEVAFLLGSCEKARGRTEAAAEAWAKVPPDSAFAFRALESRTGMELEQGRLTEAEQLVIRTCEDSRLIDPDPAVLLGAVYCQQGRINDAMRVIEGLWRRHDVSGTTASETAINQLRLYIQLQSNPVPEETIRSVLERAGEVAANDDRIWLWKAKLAIRAHSYDEASRFLDACLRKRPNDVSVWRARLDWAVATDRIAVARDALKHLPAAEFSAAQVEKLAAWFAARRGDADAERTSLERLIAADPADVAALDRLIELCAKNGQPDAALVLRNKKDEVARRQSRYQKLFKRNQPRRDAAEMGRLAEQLGRRFVARAFLTIALAAAPDRADIRGDLARVTRGAELPVGSTRTLDDLLAPQLKEDQKQPNGEI